MSSKHERHMENERARKRREAERRRYYGYSSTKRHRKPTKAEMEKVDGCLSSMLALLFLPFKLLWLPFKLIGKLFKH